MKARRTVGGLPSHLAGPTLSRPTAAAGGVRPPRESIAEHAVPAIKRALTPLERSPDVVCWNPIRVLEWTVAYVKERNTFGKALIESQHIRFKLAEIVK